MTNATHAEICTCGESEHHVIARRSTADGKHVLAWSDGSLTWALGYHVKGSPNPKTPDQIRRARAAARLLLDDVCLYDAAEIRPLVEAARWAADRGKDRDVMLTRLRSQLEKDLKRGLRPQWVTLSTHADGTVETRIWRIPRLVIPGGVAVWHERGSYSIHYEVSRSGSYSPSGITSKTLGPILSALEAMRTSK